MNSLLSKNMTIDEAEQEQHVMVLNTVKLGYIKKSTLSEINKLSKIKKKQKYLRTLTKTQQNVLRNANKYIKKRIHH